MQIKNLNPCCPVMYWPESSSCKLGEISFKSSTAGGLWYLGCDLSLCGLMIRAETQQGYQSLVCFLFPHWLHEANLNLGLPQCDHVHFHCTLTSVGKWHCKVWLVLFIVIITLLNRNTEDIISIFILLLCISCFSFLCFEAWMQFSIDITGPDGIKCCEPL